MDVNLNAINYECKPPQKKTKKLTLVWCFKLVTVSFSPAPTELEKQQEILSQRLKNYKSLHALTNSIQKPVDDLTSSLSSFVSLEKGKKCL